MKSQGDDGKDTSGSLNYKTNQTLPNVAYVLRQRYLDEEKKHLCNFSPA